MDMNIAQTFMVRWRKYFDHAELPIIFYYTNEERGNVWAGADSKFHCIIKALSSVREGGSLCFSAESQFCRGGKRYLGFAEKLMPDFEYFLSCGIPGRLEGERYKKSPELVKEAMKHSPALKAPARFIVFKRWDKLEEQDNPEVVIFFAPPDVLAGLFTLANFDEIEPDGIISPFGSGCSTIVHYPYREKDLERPRGVIGMFDISARPFVDANVLTFAVPMSKFLRMVENMEESFLTTASWEKVQKRISSQT